MTNQLQGVTPVRPEKHLPSDNESLIVFTEASLKCACCPDELQYIRDFSETLSCYKCKEVFQIPEVGYRWPPRIKV